MQKLAAARVGFAVLRESLQHEPRQDTCVQEPLGEAQAGGSSWVGRRLRESPGRVDSVSQINGESRWAPALAGLAWSGEGSTEGMWCLVALLPLERAAPAPQPSP